MIPSSLNSLLADLFSFVVGNSHPMEETIGGDATAPW